MDHPMFSYLELGSRSDGLIAWALLFPNRVRRNSLSSLDVIATSSSVCNTTVGLQGKSVIKAAQTRK